MQLLKTEPMRQIPGASDEITFWKDFVHTDQFKSWLVPGVPAPELDKVVVQHIQSYKPFPRMLDVGSGVVSILWSLCRGEGLVATDLLAAEYALFYDYQDFSQLPLAIAGEDLRYDKEFDVVHMRNALDHSQNPLRVWDNLKRACKPGGLLIVAGFEKEGSFLHQLGMHQWDLFVQEDKGLFLRPANTTDLVQLEAPDFTVLHLSSKLLVSGRRWMTWIGKRHE